jgi:hypothetical protein
MIKQCNATVNYSLEITGEFTDEQVISLADEISQERGWGILDSLDLGDAMGLFMRAAHDDFYSGELFLTYPGDTFMVEMEITHDLFHWL